MHAPEFKKLMELGLGRLLERMNKDMPLIAPHVNQWVKGLAGSEEPANYFLHPVAFPLMLLPWWLERQFRGTCDPAFQVDLIVSNASLYYYIRLVDNVMDGHATVEPKLLPTAGYFVNQFQTIYHPYFEIGHPFWNYFGRTWSAFCDVTAADGQLTDVDKVTFNSLIGRKVSAAKISVAAVCHRYDRLEFIPQWEEWIDTFGCWHLFREDLFDWQQDIKLGGVTYFLSEAKRRKAADEPVVSWMAREGLDWGVEQLSAKMEDLREMTFVSDEVLSYLDFREQEVFERCEILRPALNSIRLMAEVNGDE